MTYAALIVCGGVVITWTVGMLVMFAWARGEVNARASEQEGRIAAEKVKTEVERQRDVAIIAQSRAEADRDDAVRAAKVFEVAAAKAREELKRHVAEKLVTGSDDDVSAEVDRLLGSPQASSAGADQAAGGSGEVLSRTLRAPELP